MVARVVNPPDDLSSAIGSDANLQIDWIDVYQEASSNTDTFVVGQGKIPVDLVNPTDNFVMTFGKVFGDSAAVSDLNFSVVVNGGGGTNFSVPQSDLEPLTDSTIIDRFLVFGDNVGVSEPPPTLSTSSGTTFTDPMGLTDSILIAQTKQFDEYAGGFDEDTDQNPFITIVLNPIIPGFTSLTFGDSEGVTDASNVFDQFKDFSKSQMPMTDSAFLDYPHVTRKLTIRVGTT